MDIELTPQQKSDREIFRVFVQKEVFPYANRYDQEEITPEELIHKTAQKGFLGALAPREFGGSGMDMVTYGLLNEEIGSGCSSLRSLLTVHSMVTYAVLRWGSKPQKAFWLPKLAVGEAIGAFCLSEPGAGSDADGIETTAKRDRDHYILNGQKKWVTYGQIADLFLVFAKCEGKVSAFLVERHTPGFSIQPIGGMLGTRASMLAELHLQECRIGKECMLGGQSFGLASVAASSLDIGRYSVAWGCVGITRACLEASLQYVEERKQFGKYLKEHQLIQQMLTGMITNIRAARLLCLYAGYLKDIGEASSVMQTWIAKYFASTVAIKSASDAIQIHGANGCSGQYSLQRYFRDAKVMEIIEGSSQIQEITIARYGYQKDML